MKDDNQLMRGLVAIAVLGIVIGGVVLFTGDDDSDTASSEAPATSQVAEAEDTSQAPEATEETTSDTEDDENTDDESDELQFEDGSYEATGSYTSPGGNETIGVNLTLEGDVITDISLTNGAGHPTSDRFQEEFIEGVVELVTGVNLDEANVGNVAGSSLTGNGFNQALDDIRDEARL